jgi:hypothetical protein
VAIWQDLVDDHGFRARFHPTPQTAKFVLFTLIVLSLGVIIGRLL